MKKDKGFEWLKETIEKGKLGVSKLTKISKIKIEIASLTKKRDERLKLLGKKVVALFDKGELIKEELKDEYEAIKEIDSKIEELNEMIENIKTEKYEKEEDDEIIDDFEKDYEYASNEVDKTDDEQKKKEADSIDTQETQESDKAIEMTEETKIKKENEINE